MLTVLIGLITGRMVEPRLGPYEGDYTLEDEPGLAPNEYRGLWFALFALIGVIASILLSSLPLGASLRHPETGALIGNSPFMGSLIVSIALVFLGCGIAYGLGAGTLRTSGEVVDAITKAIASLSGLILLLLVIARFLTHFDYANMATLAAVSLAYWLEDLNLSTIWLLPGFILVILLLGLPWGLR